MDVLLQTQISFELLRENIAVRNDLFPDGMEKYIEFELNYVARYLHDVYQEHERGGISIDNGQAKINLQCKMLRDFISQKESPEQMKQIAKELRDRENEGSISVAERRELLVRTERELKDLRGKRYGSVASSFAHLAMDHIQDAVKRWLSASIVPRDDDFSSVETRRPRLERL